MATDQPASAHILDGDIALELGSRVADALSAAFELSLSPAEALVRPSNKSAKGVTGDYQCNAAMSLGKRLGKPPRDVASAIVDHLAADDIIASATIAGPGFINFELKLEWLAQQLISIGADPHLGIPQDDPHDNGGRLFVIDYSSPNVAKEMHVGHVLGTSIGDSLVRLLESTGKTVVRRNHLGDWGTQFGMLIEHMLDTEHQSGSTTDSISDLNTFYRAARSKFDSDPDFATRARQRVVQLQSGDDATLALWRTLVDASEEYFTAVYTKLGIKLTRDDSYGESFYNPYLDDTVAELESAGLTEISDGALCVFPPGFTGRDDAPLPMMVRKSDGGYGYAATDLAAMRYWTQTRGATDILYVVGSPQAQHFAMLFAVSSMAGWLDADHRATHVQFGSVLGEDGKMFKTRSGETINLIDLIDEATERSEKILIEQGAAFSDAERKNIARAVGIGAIKYANLSSDRSKDITFSWNRMLSMEGNTSVYLQYANARILSVLRKAGLDEQPNGQLVLAEPAEKELAIKLLQLPAAITSALDDYSPHKMCTYLFETATAFSKFYETCPILSAGSDEVRASRLTLAALTSKVLTRGLDLLGIEAPQRL